MPWPQKEKQRKLRTKTDFGDWQEIWVKCVFWVVAIIFLCLFFFFVSPFDAFAVLIAVVSLVLLPIVVLGVAVAVAVAIACGCCKQEIVICNPLCVRRKLDNLIWLKSLVSVAAVWLAIVGVAGVAGVAVCGPRSPHHITSDPSAECQLRHRDEYEDEATAASSSWLFLVFAGQWSYRNGGPAASETSFPHIECSCHSHN